MTELQNRRGQSWLARLAALAALGVATSLASAQAPSQITFLSAANVADGISVSIKSPTYTSQTANNLAGSGPLSLTIAGVDLPVHPTVDFSGVATDANGNVSGGTFTFSQDTALPNLYDCGVDLMVMKGTRVTFLGPTKELQLQGTLQAGLPFRDDTGARAALSLPGSASLKASGDFSLSANPVTLTGPTAANGLPLPGLVVDSGPMKFTFEKHPGQPVKFDLFIAQGKIHADLPGLVSQDIGALELNVANLDIDQDGPVSFTASLGADQTMHLAEPMDFVLTLHDATLTMQDRQIKSFVVNNADILLPEQFRNKPADDPSADRVKLTNVALSAEHGLIAQVKNAAPIDIYWNSFHLKLPASSGGGNAVLDLSSAYADGGGIEKDELGAALPPSWTGFYLKSATLDLPSEMTGPGGGPATVNVTNFFVDGKGISGDALITDTSQLASINVMGFDANLKQFEIQVSRGKVTKSGGKGTIKIPGWGGDLGVSLAISTAGLLAMDVDTSQLIDIPAFGANLQLSGGSFAPVDDGAFKVLMTGAMVFPDTCPIEALRGAALDFKDIGFDNKGHFTLGNNWIDLPHPAMIDLKLISLEVNQIGFGQVDANDPYAQKYPGAFWLGLTGDVKLAEDLPLAGQIGFDGLRVFATPKAGGGFGAPGFEIGGLHIDTEIPGLATIKGDILRNSFPTAPKNENGVQIKPVQWSGPPIDCLRGDASLALTCLGPAGGGGAVDFLVANGAWFVMGQFDMQTGIALGNTGMALYGFKGGLGHNVKPDHEGALGVPFEDYQLVPDVDAIAGRKDPSWVFVAGVRLGTVDAFTAWGDLTLTMFLPQLMIDLNGKLYLMETGVANPGPGPDDRIVSGDISWDGPNQTFRAGLNADLHFPDKSTNLFHAFGGMDLVVGPNDKHFHIGGPIRLTTEQVGPFQFQKVAIDNPVGFDVLSFPGPRGAFTVDYANGSLTTQGALTFNLDRDWHDSAWGVSVDAHVWCNLAAYFGFRFNGTSFGGANAWAIGDGGANVSASGYGMSATLGVDVGASLTGALDPNYNLTLDGQAWASVSVLHHSFDISVGLHYPF